MINPVFDKKKHIKWEYRIYTQFLDDEELESENDWLNKGGKEGWELVNVIKDKSDVSSCLLYTSPSPRDLSTSRMPSSA